MATGIAEEQHHRLEEVRLNLMTPLTSEVEASEPENHGGARHKTKSRAKSGSDHSDDEVFQLPQVPDMSITGSSHGHEVTFGSLVVRVGSISSMPHLVPQPLSFNVSRIPDSETSGKDTGNEAEVRPRTPQQKVQRTREDASMALHSLELMAEEFRKICEPKIQKPKGRYSANTMLVFNS